MILVQQLNSRLSMHLYTFFFTQHKFNLKTTSNLQQNPHQNQHVCRLPQDSSTIGFTYEIWSQEDFDLLC